MRYSAPLLICFLICCSVLTAQEGRFSFGARTALSLTQIDGDNLRGFKKMNYEIGLIGGYRFTTTDAFQLSLNYENLGSNRQGENVPIIAGNYLSEIDMTQLSLFWAYAKSFAPDWDGSHRFQAAGGLKYNRIMSTESNLVGANIIDVYTLDDDDFKSQYLSLKFGCSMFAGTRFLVGLFYEHALESVLLSGDEQRINKLVPFGLSLNLSYYLY